MGLNGPGIPPGGGGELVINLYNQQVEKTISHETLDVKNVSIPVNALHSKQQCASVLSVSKSKNIPEVMNSAAKCDRKGSRKSHRRSSKPIKRHPSRYPDCEKGEANTSASAKKLKMDEYQDVTVDSSFGYRILNFISVFSAIGDYVMCKDCDSNVEFSESNIRGLGFKVEIKCSSCPSKLINSCPITDNHAYEINKRLVFVMRILGIGAAGIRKFCGLMDLRNWSSRD